MAYARAKKHYRAVKKQIEESPKRGIFIPKKKKNAAMAIGIGIAVIVFLKGFLLGYLLGKKE